MTQRPPKDPDNPVEVAALTYCQELLDTFENESPALRAHVCGAVVSAFALGGAWAAGYEDVVESSRAFIQSQLQGKSG